MRSVNMASNLLSAEEAMKFLSDNLKIDACYATGVINSSNNNSGQRLDLLNAIIVGLHRTQPFQTLTNMAVEPQLRSLPTPDDIKADIFADRGGVCTSLNYFSQQFLSVLGYNATLVMGTVGPSCPSDGLPNHAIVIVRDVVSPGDIYLVDLGLGYATFRAVPLDFAVESPIYRDSFQPYKYVRMYDVPPLADIDVGSGQRVEFPWLARWHIRRTNQTTTPVDAAGPGRRPVLVSVAGDGAAQDDWLHCYCFTLKNIEYSLIAGHVHQSIYRNTEARLSRSLRITSWPRGRAVIVRDRTLLLEDSEGHLQATELSSDEELVDVILREFPVYDEQLVRRAVAVWNSLPTFDNARGYP